jgi:C1A family cysteine protease
MSTRLFKVAGFVTALGGFLTVACDRGGGSTPPASDTTGDVGSGSDTKPTGDATSPQSDVVLPTVDLAAITEAVKKWQDKGQNLAKIAATAGYITLDDGTTIQLIEQSKVECPPEITNCEVSDSATLGIPSEAVIIDPGLPVRNQQERGTCVSFALNGAMELLLSRAGQTVDLSEQNTYFLGKQVTNGWDYAGLYPASVIEQFEKQGLPMVPEDKWPYNPAQADCTTYNVDHPGFTCTPTEAQGGGTEGKEQDATAKGAAGYRILGYERVYASLGRLKEQLAQGNPVVVSINANIDFNVATKKQGVASWVFEDTTCDTVCGHAVLAIGYHDDPAIDGGGYVIIKNSWGTGWGDDGLVYATYEWVDISILDATAITVIQTSPK